jgi:hypothetical protein
MKFQFISNILIRVLKLRYVGDLNDEQMKNIFWPLNTYCGC